MRRDSARDRVTTATRRPTAASHLADAGGLGGPPPRSIGRRPGADLQPRMTLVFPAHQMPRRQNELAQTAHQAQRGPGDLARKTIRMQSDFVYPGTPCPPPQGDELRRPRRAGGALSSAGPWIRNPGQPVLVRCLHGSHRRYAPATSRLSHWRSAEPRRWASLAGRSSGYLTSAARTPILRSWPIQPS
jgi:hypothetical protein